MPMSAHLGSLRLLGFTPVDLLLTDRFCSAACAATCVITVHDILSRQDKRGATSSGAIPSKLPRNQWFGCTPSTAQKISGFRNCMQNCRCPIHTSPSLYGTSER